MMILKNSVHNPYHVMLLFWAAAQIGDKVLLNGEIFRLFVCLSVRPSVRLSIRLSVCPSICPFPPQTWLAGP